MLSVRMTFGHVGMMVMSSWRMHTPQRCQVLIGQGILMGSRLSIRLSTFSLTLKIIRNDPSSLPVRGEKPKFGYFLSQCQCVYKNTVSGCRDHENFFYYSEVGFPCIIKTPLLTIVLNTGGALTHTYDDTAFLYASVFRDSSWPLLLTLLSCLP